jgi:hypothetical protein
MQADQAFTTRRALFAAASLPLIHIPQPMGLEDRLNTLLAAAPPATETGWELRAEATDAAVREALRLTGQRPEVLRVKAKALIACYLGDLSVLAGEDGCTRLGAQLAHGLLRAGA